MSLEPIPLSSWWHMYGYGRGIVNQTAREVRILHVNKTDCVVRFPSGAIETVSRNDLIGPVKVSYPTSLLLPKLNFFSRLLRRLFSGN